MEKHFHFSVFVQQRLIQVVIFVLDTDVLPMLDCMLQPRSANPRDVSSPLQSATMAVLAPANTNLGMIETGTVSMSVIAKQ